MFAVIGMAAKLIGALYRIPLTNVMGAEGIGLYQMVFPLYTVLLTVTSGGIPSAVSKVTAGFNAQGARGAAKKTLWITALFVGIFSLLAALALLFGRNRIAMMQGNQLAAVAYLGIAPSIFLVAGLSVLRGYYQGSHNMLPSAVSQFVEQVVKLIAGLYLCRLLLPYGVEYAVLGAVLGVTASEAVALVGMLVWYAVDTAVAKHRARIPLDAAFETAAEWTLTPPVETSRNTVLKSVYKIAVPVTLGALVIPVTQVIDSVLVINILASFVADTATATSWYGLLNGPVNSLVNMPVVVTAAVSTALLPKVSAAKACGRDPQSTCQKALKYTWMLAAPCVAALAVFARPILSVLYARSLNPSLITLGTGLLTVGSLTVAYMAIIQVATAALQGADRAATPAVNLLIGAVVKVLLTLALLRPLGIFGAVAASVACYGVTAVLDVIALKKYVAVRPAFCKSFLAPLVSTVAAVGLGYGVFRLAVWRLSGLYALLIAAVVVVALYAGLLIITRAFDPSELPIPLRGRKKKEEGPSD